MRVEGKMRLLMAFLGLLFFQVHAKETDELFNKVNKLLRDDTCVPSGG